MKEKDLSIDPIGFSIPPQPGDLERISNSPTHKA
jgi:hypothetical protein